MDVTPSHQSASSPRKCYPPHPQMLLPTKVLPLHQKCSPTDVTPPTVHSGSEVPWPLWRISSSLSFFKRLRTDQNLFPRELILFSKWLSNCCTYPCFCQDRKGSCYTWSSHLRSANTTMVPIRFHFDVKTAHKTSQLNPRVHLNKQCLHAW